MTRDALVKATESALKWPGRARQGPGHWWLACHGGTNSCRAPWTGLRRPDRARRRALAGAAWSAALWSRRRPCPWL